MIDECLQITGGMLVWEDRDRWWPDLKAWLQPFLNERKFRALIKSGPFEESYQDDPEWLEMLSSVASTTAEDIAENFLADALLNVRLRTYHGCRVEDVGALHREGLRVNDPQALEERARQLVVGDERLAWMRPDLEKRITQFDSRERDTGRLYLIADKREQLTQYGAGHYCLYGSEWLQVLLGWEAHEVLRTTGVPTILEVDLPLGEVTRAQRVEFAETLLMEFMHAIVNEPDWVRSIDFSFVLHRDVPPEWVSGHTHPRRLFDPFHRVWRNSATTTCPYCLRFGGN